MGASEDFRQSMKAKIPDEMTKISDPYNVITSINDIKYDEKKSAAVILLKKYIKNLVEKKSPVTEYTIIKEFVTEGFERKSPETKIENGITTLETAFYGLYLTISGKLEDEEKIELLKEIPEEIVQQINDSCTEDYSKVKTDPRTKLDIVCDIISELKKDKQNSERE